MKKIAFFISALCTVLCFSCETSETEEEVNLAPVRENTIATLEFDEGFGSQTISMQGVFSDPENDPLTYSSSVSNTSVITTEVSGSLIIISEVGTGNATINVIASDNNGGTATIAIGVVVNAVTSSITCDGDNSLNYERWACDETPAVASSYSESRTADHIMITTNGIPSHDYRNQIPKIVSELNSNTKTYTITTSPTLAASPTDITDNGSPMWKIGVALNGVVLDPAPAEPFIFENTETGEYNWDWVMEPNSNKQDVGLDCATAHVQPDGTYHYHGDMVVYADQLLAGLGSGTATPTAPVQVGWAADGFPIFYKYGYDAQGNFKLLTPSYQLKSGDRPGDGVSAPCGSYNGKYTNDYEYVAGSGDLDECNGISQQITVGNFTYEYYYLITDEFPIMSRCISGTPNRSFKVGP